MSRMTLSERTAIEAGIYGRLSFQEIAKRIGKNAKYVSREIMQNRTLVNGEHPHGKECHYAKNFLEKYNDIALLADLMGHESIETTRIYLRRTASEQQALVDKIVTW